MQKYISQEKDDLWKEMIHDHQFIIPCVGQPQSDPFTAVWSTADNTVVKALGVWGISISLAKVLYILPGDVYEFHSSPSISYSTLRRLADVGNANSGRSNTDILRESFVGDVVDALRGKFESTLLASQWRKQLYISQSQPWWIPPWNKWSFSK
jgi:hypothetical protein